MTDSSDNRDECGVPKRMMLNIYCYRGRHVRQVLREITTGEVQFSRNEGKDALIPRQWMIAG